MVGLAILSGLRRGELFALRWKDIDERARMLTVREAVYDGTFGTPKTGRIAADSALGDGAPTGEGMDGPRDGHAARGVAVRHPAGTISWATCCGGDLSGILAAGTRDVAHLPVDLFVVVARHGRAGKVVAQLMGHAGVDR
jgi:hypothetical protein